MKSDNVVFDLSQNLKQQQFFDDVFKAVIGKSDNRFFFYGGAVRGGKTSVCLAILVLLAKKFPRSRWHILRDSFTTIEQTTIPSLNRFCPESPSVTWYRNKSNFHLTFRNGSKIFLVSESLYSDPDLGWMDGLETNGIMLEQLEGLDRKTFEKSKERAGSWYIDPMPPALLLSTFNPTLGWLKEEIYLKSQAGELKTPYYFLEALPTDNPFVTADQWAAWKTLDDVTYRQRIEGDWSAFAVNNPFAYSFSDKKHLFYEEEGESKPFKFKYDPSYELMISFDFNVSPMTAIAAQFVNNRIRFLKEFRLMDSNTYEMCQKIKVEYPNALFLVTGDATGHNRSALTGGTLNHYTIIQQELGLSDGQMRQPSINPSHNDARVLINSILQNFPPSYNAECKYLIEDLKYVEVDHEGKINKTKDKNRTHLLDAHTYLLNTFFGYLLSIQREEEESEELTNG